MYIVVDTETTGLPKGWNAPITDTDNWPRMVQLAWIIYDENGIEKERKYVELAQKNIEAELIQQNLDI